MAEPTPIRDNGPYESAEQAQAQFLAQSFGIPDPRDGSLANLVVREACLLTGVEVSGFEERWLIDEASRYRIDSVTAQLIAGWILRAHRAGRAAQQPPAGRI